MLVFVPLEEGLTARRKRFNGEGSWAGTHLTDGLGFAALQAGGPSAGQVIQLRLQPAGHCLIALLQSYTMPCEFCHFLPLVELSAFILGEYRKVVGRRGQRKAPERNSIPPGEGGMLISQRSCRPWPHRPPPVLYHANLKLLDS